MKRRRIGLRIGLAVGLAAGLAVGRAIPGRAIPGPAGRRRRVVGLAGLLAARLAARIPAGV